MVSHDLRAPLRAVNGYLDAIEEDHGAALGPGGGDLVGRARAAAVRMERLIGDLLEYSRLSRTEIRCEAVSLDTVVRRARADVETLLTERGATLDVDGPLPPVEANEAVLTQVVINLLVNAATYVAPGARPRIQLRGEIVDGGKARVSVTDHGIGIAKENLARIFVPFERLHGLDRYPGSGIGLAIVRKGVERLGGHVGVESTPGRGSSFWFELRLSA